MEVFTLSIPEAILTIAAGTGVSIMGYLSKLMLQDWRKRREDARAEEAKRKARFEDHILKCDGDRAAATVRLEVKVENLHENYQTLQNSVNSINTKVDTILLRMPG